MSGTSGAARDINTLLELEGRVAELTAEVDRLRAELADAARSSTRNAAHYGRERAASQVSLSAARADNAGLRAANAELEAGRDVALAGEHRLAMVLDSAVDHAIITMDLSGVITSWNPGARNIMGWEAHEIVGQLGHTIFTPEDRSAGAPEQEMQGALSEGVAVDERWHLRKDGSRFWASGLMMQLKNGKLEGYLKILRDRTGQHEAEEALKHQSEITRTIAANAADAMFLMDAKGVTTFANPASERMFGWPAAEMLGKRLHELLHYRYPDGTPYPMDQCPLGHALGSARTLSHHEDVFYRKDGSPIAVSCSIASIVRDGVAEGAALIVRDITEQKQAEERRQLLINELNHRVKNTLAIVQGVAQQTFKGVNSPAEDRKAFEARLGALAAAHNILTRENWGHAQLVEIVSGAVAPFQRGQSERLKIVGPDLRLEPKMAVSIAMAVHELATNALKHGALSNESGRVSVTWQDYAGDTGPRLKWVWLEEGGPLVVEPKKRGFGSRLVERGLASELRGTVKLQFASTGLICTVDAPLPGTVRDAKTE
jgi:PAS domain S-box-containing protein